MARAQGLAEAFLLAGDHPGHEVGVVGQLRVGIAHLLDRRRHQGGGDEALDAQGEGVANGAPDDAAQHVAAVLVGGEHAVAHEKAHGTTVIGEDAQGGVDAGVVAVGATRGLGGRVDQGGQDVGVEHRIHVLEHGQASFEAGSGVDDAHGQVDQ